MARPVFHMILICVCALSLMSMFTTIYSHSTYKRSIEKSAMEEVVGLNKTASSRINTILLEIENVASNLSKSLELPGMANDEMLDKLRLEASANKYIFGIAVSYEPYAFKSNLKLYAPYMAKKDGKLQLIRIDKIYDYTLPDHKWYGSGRAGPVWIEPFYGKASGALGTAYSRPFKTVRSGDELAGVVTIFVSLDRIMNIVKGINLGPSGFGALVSREGKYLYHPNRDFVRGLMSVDEVASKFGDSSRKEMWRLASQGERGLIPHRSLTTDLDSWLIFDPIPSSGWSLQSTFIKDDIVIAIDTLRRQLFLVTTFAVIFIFTLVALFINAGSLSIKGIWLISLATAVSLQVGIFYLWHLSLQYDEIHMQGSTIVADNITLENMKNAYTSDPGGNGDLLLVPTGVYIESVQMNDSNMAELSGILWQKYSLGSHDGLSRGVLVERGANLSIVEIERIVTEEHELLRWKFNGSVQQTMDTSRYPLEQGNIVLNLRHKDTGKNVMLIPDLDSYEIMNPTSLPGLPRGIHISGWKVQRSFFSMGQIKRNTNFGMVKLLDKGELPELSFNIRVQRNFMDSFISSLTPLFVVGFFLFSAILLETKDQDRLKLLGGGLSRTLGTVGGLFFVVAFSHIGTRQKIAADEIFYLEYFYFLMYGALLWVSISSLLFWLFEDGMSWIKYKDNLLSKVLYWPSIMFALYIATFYTFY